MFTLSMVPQRLLLLTYHFLVTIWLMQSRCSLVLLRAPKPMLTPLFTSPFDKVPIGVANTWIFARVCLLEANSLHPLSILVYLSACGSVFILVLFAKRKKPYPATRPNELAPVMVSSSRKFAQIESCPFSKHSCSFPPPLLTHTYQMKFVLDLFFPA
ncbi:MAG: hypothetical protein BYD32DRAFT_433037 [Podila humilis]|nr:MAG: hypothetical protein BYD32DRAFT_433037 [Podila humilis]